MGNQFIGGYSATLDLNISSVKGSLAQLQSQFGKLDLTAAVQSKLDSTFKDLDKYIKAYDNSIKKVGNKPINIGGAVENFNAIQSALGNLEKDINKFTGKEIKLRISPEAQKDLNIVNNKLSKINDLKAEYNKLVSKGFASIPAADPLNPRSGIQKQSINYLKQAIDAGKDYDAVIADIGAKRKALIDEGKGAITNVLGSSLSKGLDLSSIDAQRTSLERLKATLTGFRKGIPDKNAFGIKDVNALEGAITKATQAETLFQKTNGLGLSSRDSLFAQATTDATTYKAVLNDTSTAFKALFSGDIKSIEQANVEIEKLMQSFQKITNLDPKQASAVRTEITKMFEDANKQADAVNAKLKQQSQITNQQARITEQYNMIASRIKYTFSLVNGMYMFQRIVRSAFTSVKELDASMNSIAVVTDMTTKDLWKQIDAYQSLASAMGSTVKGSYDVAKLYYQQGRNSEDVNILTKETLKLSRISGIEYSDATNFMTAALNGFKLEVKDASRVTDIYSNLAAKAAVDQKDIAYAMTKTASIANNAGMSIENTSALLTQMMETTREAPENIGTAMKTIIARFAEMKSNVGTVFTDEDGEMVDVNRVEGALRAAGVKLRDAITGEIRPIDQVFLELASKWDGLSKNTQRYVATISAGARQQSRFIAMMDNYKRTLELVAIAEDSAGAGDTQFAKTLDSLESKLNKLKNAWVEFTTGIANSNMIKFVVDALTGLLNVVNKLTSVPGGGLGKLLLLFGGFKLAGGIIAKTVDGFTKILSKAAVGNKLQGVGQVLAGQISQGMTDGTQLKMKQVLGNAIVAKTLNNQLTRALVKNPEGLTFSQLGDVFTDKRNKEKSNDKLTQRLKSMGPQLGEFTSKLTNQFENSLRDLPDDVKALGAKSVEAFNAGVESGNFKGAIQKYSDFYSTDLPALQQEAADQNKKILQDMDWSENEDGTLRSNAADMNVGPEVLIGSEIDKYNTFYKNKAIADAKAPKDAKVAADTVTSLSTGLSSLGDAAGMSAQAIGGIAQILGGMGFKGAAGLLNGIATAFGILGSAIAAAGAIANLGWLPVYGIILGIMAIAGAAIGITAAIKASSPEAKLAKATATTKLAEDAATQAQSQYKQLMDTIDSNSSAVSSIAALTKGTIEFKQAVLEANTEMVKLLNQHPELNTPLNITRNENGVLTPTEAGKEALISAAYEGQVSTQMALNAAQIKQNKAQEAVDFKALVKNSFGYFQDPSKGAAQAIIDYMGETGTSATGANFWESPAVKTILDQYFSTGTDDAATNSGNELVRNTLKESGALFDTYVSNNLEKQAQNAFLYGQMGETYKTSSQASKLIKNSGFTDLANNYLQKNFVPAASEGTDLRYGVGNTGIDIFGRDTEAMYSREQAKAKAAALGFNGNYKQSLLRLYIEKNKNLGYKFGGKNNQEVVDSEGNVLDINSQNKQGIIDALATYEQGDSYGKKLEELVTTLDTQTADTKESFTKLATDAGTLNNTDYTIMKNTLDGMDQDSEAKKILSAEYQKQLKARMESSATLLNTVQEIGGSSDQLNSLQAKLGSMTKDQTDAMNIALSGVNKNFGEAATNKVYDQMMGLSGTSLADYSATLSKIDYSNSITSLSSINGLIKSASASQKVMLTDLQTTMKEQTSESQLFSDLATSDGFKDVQTELTKLYNTNDKLTGANIRDLAKDSKILGDYLDVAGVSAEGLASVLEQVEIGNVGIEGVTDSLLAAVSAASQLQTVLGKGFEFIDNKKWARSEAELGKFATDAAGTILTHFAAGQVGDSEALDMYGFLFGAKTRKEVVDAMTAASDAAGTDAVKAKLGIQKALQVTGDVLAKVQKAGNLKPLWEYYNKNMNSEFVASSTDAFTASITEQGLQLTNLQGNTKEVVEQLQNMYNISEELATLMLGDLISNTAGLSDKLQAEDYEDMVDAWTSKVDEKGFLLQSEIDLLKKMYPAVQGEIDSAIGLMQDGNTVVLDLEIGWSSTPEEAYNKVRDAFLAAAEKAKAEGRPGITLNDFVNEKVGQTKVEAPKSNLLPEDQRLLDRVAPPIPAGTYADYEQLVGVFTDLGASTEEAKVAADSYVSDTKNGIVGLTKTIQTFDKATGGWKDTAIYSNTSAGLDEKEAQAQVTNLAAAISTAMGTIMVSFDGDTDAVDLVISTLQSKVINIPVNFLPVGVPKVSGIDGISRTAGAMGRAKGKTDSSSGLSFIGEKDSGREIVQTKNGAYLTQGPQFVNLKPEDIVYTNAETEQILKNKPKLFPRFDNGQNNDLWGYLGGFTFNGASGVGGGTGAEAKDDKFKNDLDKQYNLLQIIEDILRRQEKLQEQLIDDAKESATAVADNLAAQTELMEADLESSQELLKRRKKEVEDYLKESEKFAKYGSYDAESNLIKIDWDAINASGDKAVLEYIDKLEKLQENVQDAEDKIDEANQTLQDIADQGKDTFYELQDRLYEAVVEREQGIIDGLSSNNDAINNSNTALMDSLQKSINDDRQARDNTNTEKDIADKQRRLALLQRDTSGSYGLEIKQLQEEIKASQEDYTDTLVDQAISELQDSYDLASEAREREIEMMQNQKDWREENGYYWNEVIGLLSGSGYGAATDQAAIDQIMKLLSGNDAEFIGASQDQKDQYLEELTSQFSDALGWYWNQAENQLIQTRTETLNNTDGTQTVNNYQTITYYDPNGTVSGTGAETLTSSSIIGTPTPVTPGTPTTPGGSGSTTGWTGVANYRGVHYEHFYPNAISKGQANSWAMETAKVMWNAQNPPPAPNPLKPQPNQPPVGTPYATGGLADYTGPAWLDGTKARPEIVLNQADSQNFLVLKDVLRDLLRGDITGGKSEGLTQIQVDLHVDKLDNSTDMDALVAKVENAIVKKAKYRNVTVLGMSR